MTRILIVTTFLLFLNSCTPSRLPQRDYYGILRMDGYNVRLVYSNTETKPSFHIIGFRAYEAPIHHVSFKNDTLRFNREDAFSTYKGHYDANTGKITGLWTGEDSIARPLIFLPARVDTIVGLNPRTTTSYEYEQPPDENDGISVRSLETANMNTPDGQPCACDHEKEIRVCAQHAHRPQ
ncbi:MAG: hypothetical protein WEB30_17850 [Cyclobacteriaceae bacterium]